MIFSCRLANFGYIFRLVVSTFEPPGSDSCFFLQHDVSATPRKPAEEWTIFGKRFRSLIRLTCCFLGQRRRYLELFDIIYLEVI